MTKQLMRDEWKKLSDQHLEEVRKIVRFPDAPVTQSAYARYVGLSTGRISQMVRAGQLELTSQRKIIPRQADRARELSKVDIIPDNLEAGNDLKHELLKHRTEHELQKSRRAKLKADEEEGLLIPASDVSRYVFEVGRTIRSSLQTIPVRVSAELSGITDAFLIQQILEREIETALRKLSETFEAGETSL